MKRYFTGELYMPVSGQQVRLYVHMYVFIVRISSTGIYLLWARYHYRCWDTAVSKTESHCSWNF